MKDIKLTFLLLIAVLALSLSGCGGVGGGIGGGIDGGSDDGGSDDGGEAAPTPPLSLTVSFSISLHQQRGSLIFY